MTKTKNVEQLDELFSGCAGHKSELLGMLQQVQERYSYLPKEALRHIAEKMNIPLSQAYSLATFYKAFSLKPRGKYLISLCVGTACHVRGAGRILDELQRKLRLKAGQTSDDNLFTLETVNCLGCCAIGPVMMINDKYYGQLTVRKVDAILDDFKMKSKSKK